MTIEERKSSATITEAISPFLSKKLLWNYPQCQHQYCMIVKQLDSSHFWITFELHFTKVMFHLHYKNATIG